MEFITPEGKGIDVSEAKTALDILWPWHETLPYPESFNLVQDFWLILDEGTPNEEIDYDHGPLAVVRMPNGASVNIAQIDPFDRRSDSMEWRGNWDEYTNGDMLIRDFMGGIFSVLLMLTAPKYDESSV